MTEFKSNVVEIRAKESAIFEFLNDFNNFEMLLPDQVINWQSTKTSCSFTIQGMTDMAMRIEESVEYSRIQYVSDGKSPFDFSLVFFIQLTDSEHSEVHCIFSADLNPMIRMMASRPLQNFVNLLVEKLKERMESS
jgi:carbon monoxide dehydrogenase subunit G